jgi:hypothetical protein
MNQCSIELEVQQFRLQLDDLLRKKSLDHHRDKCQEKATKSSNKNRNVLYKFRLFHGKKKS